MAAKPDKHPRVSRLPTTGKHPRLAPGFRGGALCWRLSTVDKGGPFSWTALPADRYQGVVEKLFQFETMSETDIRAQGSHPIEAYRLGKAARDRLVEIQQDDVEELMSFRLTGAGRVWCRMDRNVMLVLWWDPEHRVYPVEKRNT